MTHHHVTQQTKGRHTNRNKVNDPTNDPADNSQVTTQIISMLMVHKGYNSKICSLFRTEEAFWREASWQRNVFKEKIVQLTQVLTLDNYDLDE